MQLGPPQLSRWYDYVANSGLSLVLKCAADRIFSSLAVTTLVWTKRPFRNSWTQILLSVLSFGGLFLFHVETKANKLQGSELFPLNKQGILLLCADVQQPYTENPISLSILSYCSEIHFIFSFFLMGPILWTLSQRVREVVPVALLRDYLHFLESKEEHLVSQM